MSPATAITPGEAARQAQRRAADPLASAWVSANAGTGKTQVLTDRILRLLLAGVAPERILALTYTKAAAAEMATRVFERLASWVTAPPAKLDAALADLCGRPPTDAERLAARRLFATAIETPGGLKVQTIHGFCERLLQRFPLEAGVAPGFQILDDRQAADLLRAATDQVLLDAAGAPESDLGQALARLVANAVDDQFDGLVRQALSERDWLAALVELGTNGKLQAVYAAKLGLPADRTIEELQAEAAGVLVDAALDEIVGALKAGSVSEAKLAPKFQAVRVANDPGRRVEALEEALLTEKGTPRKTTFVKATAAARPDLPPLVSRAQDTFVTALHQLQGFAAMEATLALGRLASAVLDHYSAAKARAARLDFDDLIRRTLDLLAPASGDTTAASWVLFKLDGGLDHVLVDEAQDTSRQQWALIEALTGEFFADAAAERPRSLFAVGDEKQSIYSFQGAAPELLRQMGKAFASKAVAAGRPFHSVPLTVSFRTTEPVLDAVDKVFASAARTPGVTVEGDLIRHIANRTGHAGLIEIWNVERSEDVETADPWRPLAEPTLVSPVARLAQRIAATIAAWLNDGERLASEDRPVRAGDILILVSKRGQFAPAMVAALKNAKVPVAGADRLVLTEQLAVEDLLRLADVLVLPEDDLALATVLKSPLFDLDDDALIDLTDGESGATLWSRLLDRAEIDKRFEEAATRLKAWRQEADFQPPYEFFAGLLDREHGLMRRRLLDRLGAEAADPLDELLALALDYDRTQAPSLQGFLTWLRSGRPQIKRDMDQGRDEVRVMTVHGAKGLEAPIVFLPDTCAARAGRTASLLPLADELRVWAVKGTKDHQVIEAAREAVAEREAAERDRLLYVAMTRPRDRLYIAGFFAGEKEIPSDCWYAKIDAALSPLLTTATDAAGLPVRRLASTQQVPAAKPRRAIETVAAAATLPAWALTPPRNETAPTIPLVPSKLAPLDTDAIGDPIEAAPPPRDEPPGLPPTADLDTRRFLRGTLTHALLEHLPSLPAERWATAAAAFVEQRGAPLSPRQQRSIVSETLAILQSAKFAPLFGPQSQAEVPIVAVLDPPAGRRSLPLRLTGIIDRLAVTDAGVLILDYKTNRPPPTERTDVPMAYRLQLAAYRLAIRGLYPGLPVTAAILWTDGARLMEIPDTDLDAVESALWG